LVSTSPGAMPLTRMPSSARASPSVRVRPNAPVLERCVCLRQCCRADRRDGQDRSISQFLVSPIGFHVTKR
jgi:hypothetical protein